MQGSCAQSHAKLRWLGHHPGLFQGLAGIVWTLAQLQRCLTSGPLLGNICRLRLTVAFTRAYCYLPGLSGSAAGDTDVPTEPLLSYGSQSTTEKCTLSSAFRTLGFCACACVHVCSFAKQNIISGYCLQPPLFGTATKALFFFVIRTSLYGLYGPDVTGSILGHSGRSSDGGEK